MKKKFILITIIILVILLSALGIHVFYKQNTNIIPAPENKTILIENHYSDYVKLNKDSDVYNESLEVLGNFKKDTIIDLNEITINEDTKYFDFSFDGILYKIPYENVDKYEVSNIKKDDRYKNYVPFNESISGTDVNIYKDDVIIFTLNSLNEKEVIYKDDNKLFVEINDELYYVLEESVSINKTDTNYDKADDVPVIAYHFVYEDGDPDCNQIICHYESQFREQFQYLKDNNYFTMNTSEMELFVEGNLNVPLNSILITIDDGYTYETYIPIINEYELNVTLFVVTSWFDEKELYSPYIELASHTHDLHKNWECPPTSFGQGSALNCYPMEDIVSDLKISSNEVGGTTAFCYPFYEFTNHAIEALKEAGFKTAYHGGMWNAKVGDNPYKIPRITIHKTTTLNEFIGYVS